MYAVVIPSANAANLAKCVESVRLAQPVALIIAVDDGASEEYDGPPIAWIGGVKPFCFARNANIGIRAAAPNDVILLNDDALLETPGGFDALAQAAKSHGAVSAAIAGQVGNTKQYPGCSGPPHLRPEPKMLCFVAVYLPRTTIEHVGLLDERLVAYGFDDDDYCRRIRLAGMDLAIFDGCIVTHGKLRSTYRRGNGAGDLRKNREIYERKWANA